jgi:hypothetical protein
MKIAIDNVQPDIAIGAINLSGIKDLETKYVKCVDSKVDWVITSDDKTAKFLNENGIKANVLVAVS